MSVVVLGPKDTAPAHDEAEEDDENTDGTDLQSMVFQHHNPN